MTEGSLKAWLMALYNKHGFLTPELVKEAARPPDSPAHAYVFALPPDEAAEAFYTHRAHELLRRVNIRVMTPEKEAPRPVRMFHAVKDGDEGGYIYLSAETLARRPDKMELARNDAVQRLKDAERAIEDLDIIATLADEVPEKRFRRRRALVNVREARELIATAAD